MSNKELEIKNKLPDGWTKTILEDIVFILDNKRIPVSAAERTKRLEKCSSENLVPYYGATGQAGVINDYLFDEELILLGEDGVPFYDNSKHKAYMIYGKSWVNNHAHVLKAVEPYIDSKYILHYLNVFDYHGYVTGTTRLKLNQQSMKKIPIKLPPLNEQKRIVSKIEKLFSNLDNSDKYLVHLEKQLKRYRQSVLKSAFEAELTKKWREKQTKIASADELLEKIKLERIEYIESEIRNKFQDKTEKWIKDKVTKEFDKFYSKLKPIEEKEKPFTIPTEWKWVRLDELSKKITDGTHHTPTYTDSGVSFISVKDIKNKKINFEECKYISEEEHNELYKRCNPENNDVLITKSGTIGRTCVVNVDRNFSLFVSVALIKPFTNLLNPYYLMYRLDNYIFMTNIQQTIKGGVIKNLHIVDMRQLVFPIFSLEEQNQIVKQIEKHFSIIDKLEDTVQKSIKESKRLKQSILKQAFEGKLVEQDPNDESAEILLEKIAKAKEEYKLAQKEQKKRKK